MSVIWNPVSREGEEPFIGKFRTWGEVIQHYKTEKNRLSTLKMGRNRYLVLGVNAGDYYMELINGNWHGWFDMYVTTHPSLDNEPHLNKLKWVRQRNGEYWGKGEFWMMLDSVPSKFLFINWQNQDPFEDVKE